MDTGYFDEFGLLNPHRGEKSTNGILFLAEYLILVQQYLKEGYQPYMSDFLRATLSMEQRPGEFSQTPWVLIDTDRASHDNVTAIASITKRYGMHTYARINVWKYPHPRDFFFYLWLQRNFFGWLFLWVPAIAMIFSCLRRYKADNGKEDTDGKLLCFVRLHCTHMPITNKICTALLKHHYGERYWSHLFSIYFEDPQHPIRLAAWEAGI